MKPIFRIIPLIYFIGLSLFWATENYMSLGLINYIAVTVAIVLMVQLFIKNKVAGLVIGIIMVLFSLYMLGALLSDLAMVNEVSSGTYKLMAFGGGLFGGGLIMAVVMVAYWIKFPSQVVIAAPNYPEMISMDNDLAKILVLVILQRMPERANAYGVCRMLEWKFKYFGYSNILNQLEEDKFIRIDRKQISDYYLEPAGIAFIAENMDEFKTRIFMEFPSESEFLTVLTKP